MANANVAKAELPEMINGNLAVTREVIKDKTGREMKSKEGRTCYAYNVKGFVRGRKVKVDFIPKDKGGYEPLDIVFDVSPKAELIIEEKVNVQADGSKSYFTAYTVRTIDEMGIPYECDVKPQRNSDKSLLNMLLEVAARNIE